MDSIDVFGEMPERDLWQYTSSWNMGSLDGVRRKPIVRLKFRPNRLHKFLNTKRKGGNLLRALWEGSLVATTRLGLQK